MRLAHIVASSRNRVIGVDGQMPWHLPTDLRFFRNTTLGHAIIMGRKTFESIGGPLPGRQNIVLSRSSNVTSENGWDTAASVSDAIDIAARGKFANKGILFVIGGGHVYEQTIDCVHVIFQTEVGVSIHGDTFYPEIPVEKFDLESEEAVESDPVLKFRKYVSRT